MKMLDPALYCVDIDLINRGSITFSCFETKEEAIKQIERLMDILYEDQN